MFLPKQNTGGAITVANDHIFADTTARDAYFVTNPTELVDNLPIYITSTESLQQYKVATSSWLDMTPTIMGPTGPAGADGTDGIDGTDGHSIVIATQDEPPANPVDGDLWADTNEASYVAPHKTNHASGGIDQILPSDIGAQPVDATLTAIAGLTTSADKLPYFTGTDTATTTPITAAARSLLDDTTTTAMRDTLSAASSTTATQSIYVDKAATGAGTGVDWANAFTTGQAAINSLPAIINHAVTIYIRKGTTPYRETITIQRSIAGGSLEIRGEYYWYNQAATNATVNRLVKAAADDFSAVEVGDVVFLMPYSGTYQASSPSTSYVGTVTDVTNRASGYVTVSMGSSVTPTAGWQYVIVRTQMDGSDDGTTPVRNSCFVITGATTNVLIRGLNLVRSNSFAINSTNAVLTVQNCILQACKRGITISSSQFGSVQFCYIASTTTDSICALAQNLVGAVADSALAGVKGGASIAISGSSVSRMSIYRNHIKNHDYAIAVAASYAYLQRNFIDSDNTTGIWATFGGYVADGTGNTNSATTPKNPASSTDWNFIGV
jgi:hypothetical protein